MRRVCAGALLFVAPRRSYRTPLGGPYFEPPLPAPLGAKSRGGPQGAAKASAGRRGARRRERLAAPLTAEGLRAQLRRLADESALYSQRRADDGAARVAAEEGTGESAAMSREEMQRSAAAAGDEEPNLNPSPNPNGTPNPNLCATALTVAEGDEQPAVLPGSTVFAGDLDAVERGAWREHCRRGESLPPLAPRAVLRTAHATAFEVPLEAEEPLPAEENPHFPLGASAPHAPQGEAPGDCAAPALEDEGAPSVSSSVSSSVAVSGPGGMAAARGVEYWADPEPRAQLQRHVQFAADAAALESLAEGAVDTAPVAHAAALVRRETLLYFQAHPINEMIQEPFVRIRAVEDASGNVQESPSGGGGGSDSAVKIVENVDLPVAAARRTARALGLDLVRVGTIYSQRSDRRVIALCIIADHRVHLREMLRFKLQKRGVQPPPVRPCIEVPFRGGTHPHAVRFKSVGIAKQLLRGHVVRVNITDFGTPREGFPALRDILDAIRTESLRLKAFHSAGTVRATYDEIFCYLYPSTGRSPKTEVTHPSDEALRAARDKRILEDEREIYFDDLHDQPSVRARLAYERRLSQGTAWAAKDAGLSLQRQRSMKVMLGYLPKGNREMYAARGDVDVPAPFRASHPTSASRWTNPPEANVDQASRGAAVLGQRHSMTVSEMHDRGETADSPATLDRFYYRLQGPALEAGELKEALGLKRNRKTVPRAGPGWGTLGVAQSQAEPWSAAK